MLELIVRNSENDESRSYVLDPVETVLKLKEQISLNEFHSIESLILTCANIELMDNASLNSYEFPNNEVILVIKDLFSLNFETNLEKFATMSSYHCKVSKNDSIGLLKEKLANNLHIPIEIIGLRFENVILENSKFIKDYHLNDNSLIEFGLNVCILEMSGVALIKYNVKEKFIDKNLLVLNLIEEYCNENLVKIENVQLEYQNNKLSNESEIIEVIRNSKEPIFQLKVAVEIRFSSRNRDIFEFHMFANESIAELKAKLQTKFDWFHGTEILMIDNKILENHNSLKSYGVRNVYEVFVGFLLNIDGHDYNVNRLHCFVCTNTSIVDVKRKYEPILNIDIQFINLVIGYDELDSSKFIGDYPIDENTVINLKIGIKIILFVIDDLIEFFLKPDSTINDVKQFIAKKKNIGISTVRLMIENYELCEDDDLVGMAKMSPDLIIIAITKIDVRVRHPSGEINSLELLPNMSINELKDLISNNYRLIKESIKLRFDNLDLDDNETIEFYRINDESVIEVLIQNRVSVTDEEGNVHSVFIEPTDLIFNLKQLLSYKIKTGFSTIHLYLDGCYLDNLKTIESYKIDFNSLLVYKVGLGVRFVDESQTEYMLVRSEFGTVKSLKNSLFSDFAIDPKNVTLFLGNRELQDNDLVKNLKIEEDVVVRIFHKRHSRRISREYLSIYVCNLTNDFEDFVIVSMEIKPVETVRNIKEQVFENRDVDLDLFVVSFLGDHLDDDTSIDEYDIETNQAVMIKCKNRGCAVPSVKGIVVNVKRISNDSGQSHIYKYLIDNYQSILILKQKLRDELNIPITSISLFFQGNQLKNEDSFISLDVESESVILMQITEDDQRICDFVETIRLQIRYAFLTDNNNGGIEQIELKRSDPVSDLKEQISLDRQIATGSFVVTFMDEIMVDRNSLESYGLVNGSKIVACHSVLVKHFSEQDGNSSTVRRFPIESTDRVCDLKSRIGRKLNLLSPFIKLNYQGDYLEEETSILDLEMENESYLMMVTTLRGGGFLI